MSTANAAHPAPQPEGPAREILASLRSPEILMGEDSWPRSHAVQHLRDVVEQMVVDLAASEWVRDPARTTGADALSLLCIYAAQWSAAFYASDACVPAQRFQGSPTSADGRDWFHEQRWLPFLVGLERLIGAIGLEDVQARARGILMDLARSRTDFKTLLVPGPLLKALSPDDMPVRRSGRPRKTPAERAREYASAIYAADERPGAARGRWFPLSELADSGIQRPRDQWTPALRVELEAKGIEIRQLGGRKRWEIRVTRR